MTPGIIICSRVDSKRLPSKPFIKFEGLTIIEHLIQRLAPSGLKIIIATPEKDSHRYHFLLKKYRVFFYAGFTDSPLHRMAEAAWRFDVDPIIRITHDKIFVDPTDISHFLAIHHNCTLDYLYSSDFVEGTGFEVISRGALLLAATRIKKSVEHISYAIKATTKNIANIPLGKVTGRKRLLIDYPEDLKTISTILSSCGPNANKAEAIAYLDKFPKQNNLLPELTIYTCAYNAKPWIRQTIESILSQDEFESTCEYIIVDDASTDGTDEILKEYANRANITVKCSSLNVGLASSSNVALGLARGKYIIRLDADDYFTANDVCLKLLMFIKTSSFDVVYPDYYFGDMNVICKGHMNHHIGGAIFRTSAVNHIKFTDGLRGYEGYDFFERAKKDLNIGYLDSPTFFYRQHSGSLTKNNIQLREQIKQDIDHAICENLIH